MQQFDEFDSDGEMKSDKMMSLQIQYETVLAHVTELEADQVAFESQIEKGRQEFSKERSHAKTLIKENQNLKKTVAKQQKVISDKKHEDETIFHAKLCKARGELEIYQRAQNTHLRKIDDLKERLKTHLFLNNN